MATSGNVYWHVGGGLGRRLSNATPGKRDGFLACLIFRGDLLRELERDCFITPPAWPQPHFLTLFSDHTPRSTGFITCAKKFFFVHRLST
jgi:hypothetical protein